MAIPFRPLGTWDIKVELGTAGVLGVRDSDVLSLINLSPYDAIGIVDLEDAASTEELTLVLLDGRRIRPTALGTIPGSNVTLSMAGSQLQITGNDLVEVTRWSDRSFYAPTATGYSFFRCSNLVKVPITLPRWVTSTSNMFYDCGIFNQNLSTWDMSNVTDIGYMFTACINFNQDLSGWDTSNVTIMTGVFGTCSAFNGDVSTWNTSNVIDMGNLFFRCYNFNQDLSNWDTSKVTNMIYMFYDCTLFNQDISQWNVSNVTNMTLMFSGAATFNQTLSSWCVSKILSLPRDFSTGTPAWVLPKPVWGTCPAKPIMIRLSDGRTITPTALGIIPNSDVEVSIYNNLLRISGYDLVEVVWWTDPPSYAPTVTGYSFMNCRNLIKVPATVPSWITEFANMFNTCTFFNQDLSGWDTSNITNMSNMFSYATAFNGDVSTWDVSNVTDIGYMFNGCTLFNQDISGWDTSKVTNMTNVFYGNANFNGDLSRWNVSNVTNMNSMFRSCTNFNSDLSGWCVSNLPTPPVDFDRTTSKWTLPKPVWGTCPPRAMVLRLSNDKYHRVTTIGNIPDSNVTITGDSNQLRISGSDVIEVLEWHQASPDETYVKGYQFVDCTGLIKVPAIIPGWITKLSGMFYGCTKFNQDLSGWVTTNVTTMHRMFFGATMFNKPLDTWNVSNVTDMEGLFYGCSVFNQNLPSWDTSNVTTMRGMFTGCTAFNGDIDMWVTDAVTNMEATFQDCVNFNRDLSMWCVGNLATQPAWFKDGAVAWTLPKPEWGTCPIRQIVLHTDGEKSNFNVYSYFGNPTEVTDYVLVVDHEIYSSGSTVPALTTGVFPVGSTLTIINNSYIRGAGGNAGNPGLPGGTSITANMSLTIDNTTGYIWAGGGGGGLGIGFLPHNPRQIRPIPGGGGAGRVVGTGSSNGTSTTGGPGTYGSYVQAAGGPSGKGGACGVAGTTGSSGNFGEPGGAGGRGGYSVQLNGNALTWVGGNDATRVKGAIV